MRAGGGVTSDYLFLRLLSGGRIEFGMGDSATKAELFGFGASLEETSAIFDEVVREIPMMFAETPYPDCAGEYVSLAPRNIVPKSKQKSHPPLWMASSNINKIEQAARMGAGELYFASPIRNRRGNMAASNLKRWKPTRSR